MPSMPMSSMRPMKGEMKLAPALAASSAWLAEKHSVTLTRRPSERIALQAFSPSSVSGTLMQILSAIFGEHLGLRHHLRISVAATSAETGPSTMSQISLGHVGDACRPISGSATGWW